MKTRLTFILLAVFLMTMVVHADQRGVKVKAKSGAAVSAADSNYYAIIIGNNNYRNMNKLRTAVNDARDIEKLLKDKYGFRTKLLLDATRTEILDTISEFREKVGGKDSLLIYYAGHGIFDDKADKAYWLPVDAKRNSDANWIIADDITANIRRIPSSHVLIVSDSCYSGKLTRAEIADMRGKGEREGYLRKMSERPSRTLMASGGNEPVSDSGGGNNSVFASAFIRALREAETGVFSADELFYGTGKLRGVKSIVAGKSDQLPEYAEIRNSGHDGGDFVFLAKGTVVLEEPASEPEAVSEPATPQSTTGSVTVKSNAPKAKVYINGKYQGEAPVTKTLEAGNYEIEAREDGYVTGKETVRVERDKSKTVSLLLDKAVGSIKVSSDPSGAKIYLDGAYTDTTPGSITDLKAGSYKIKVSKDGYREYAATVRVTEGQEAEVSANLETIKKASPKVSGSGGGDSYTDPTTGMEFVLVKGGCFQMGDTFGDGNGDEKPVHEVCVDDFYMGKYEVTNEQFRKFRSSHDSKDYSGISLNGDNQPAVYVSWDDAVAYAKWLSDRTGQRYRLPTEAEWEYAARGGTQTRNYWGNGKDDACRYANVHDRTSKSKFSNFTWESHNCDDGYAVTSPVGSFQSNAFGLYDMMGNAWEWVQDKYDSNAYSSHSRNNPIYESSGASRVLRGGSWSGIPDGVRASFRTGNTPGYRLGSIGFRLLRTP